MAQPATKKRESRLRLKMQLGSTTPPRTQQRLREARFLLDATVLMLRCLCCGRFPNARVLCKQATEIEQQVNERSAQVLLSSACVVPEAWRPWRIGYALELLVVCLPVSAMRGCGTIFKLSGTTCKISGTIVSNTAKQVGTVPNRPNRSEKLWGS